MLLDKAIQSLVSFLPLFIDWQKREPMALLEQMGENRIGIGLNSDACWVVVKRVENIVMLA